MESIPFLLLSGLLVSAFFGIAYASHKISFPSVLFVIFFGIISGKYLTDISLIHTVADVGIVLLFFVLGMEFPISKVLDIGKKVWPAGLLDVFLNIIVVFFISNFFGFDIFSSLIIAGVVYATSSSITVKLLEDKRRLANQETDFILALLIFEDLVAPVLVSLLVAMKSGQEFSSTMAFLLILKIFLLIFGAIIIGFYGFRKLSNFISSQLEKDFMPLFSVGIALLYSGLAVYLGLSEILGAFLAGVILSETGKATELSHLVFPIRDITLPFFFFWFGTTIDLGSGITNVWFLVILIIFSIFGKIITGFYGGKLYGLSKKVALRAGLSLVQRGEFSIIIASIASVQLRIFSGIYVFITALVGSYLFSKAPKIAKKVYGTQKNQT